MKKVTKSKALCGDGFNELDSMFGSGSSKPQTKKLKVKCPGCKKQFTVEIPGSPVGGTNFNESPSSGLGTLSIWRKNT